MSIYLPIAEITANPLLLFALGASVGFIGGMFGVGGGFLLTPLLIFLGIPPAVAIASQSSQIAASSTIGVLNAIRRGTIDLRFGTILVVGGIFGTMVGVSIFNQLKNIGSLDTAVSFSFIVLFSLIGATMLLGSIRALLLGQRGAKEDTAYNLRPWYFSLPLPVHFPSIGIDISLIPIFVLSFFVGIAGSFLGIGGGFIIVPALIYLFRVPIHVAVGTATYQILFTMLCAVVFHATTNYSVDAVLAVSLIFGTLFGTQFGISLGQLLPTHIFRLLFAILVLSVDARFIFDLITIPEIRYSVTIAAPK